MTTAPPRLRADVVISERQVHADGVSYIVKDPRRNQFFRFREAQRFIARLLDGSTPLDAIQRRVKEELGASITAARLQDFIDSLRRSGLLEDSDRATTTSDGSARKGRIRGTLLYLRFDAFDPDRLLAWLARRLGFAFTTCFAVLSLFVLLLAVLVTAFNWAAIEHAVLGLFHFRTLVLAWITVVLVGMVHEFAHGLACKRFGGEVHEMGFLLLYFNPALYCNVSDAWLFPEKSKRLLVTFAGAYVELLVWALATLTWRFSDPATIVNWAALVVMTTSGLKTLLNFNPLIKLDGYYLLSDALEIPNLRKKAFRYLGGGICRLFGSSAGEPNPLSPRDRRIFLCYGLLAAVFSIGLLLYVAFELGGYLIGEFQLPGFLALGALLSPRIRSRISRFFPNRSTASKKARHAEPEAARTGRRAGWRSGRLKAWCVRLRRWTIRLAILGALAAIACFGRMPLKITGEFRILPSKSAHVRAGTQGVVVEILVREGDAVTRGDPIVRLSDREARAELEVVGAEIAEKQARRKVLVLGPRSEEIDMARTDVETTKTKLEHAGRRLEEASRLHNERLSRATVAVGVSQDVFALTLRNVERSRVLLEGGLVSQQEFEDAEEDCSLRRKELEEARADLGLLKTEELAAFRQEVAVAEKLREQAEGRLQVLLAGSRREEIEAATAEISQLEIRRAYLESELHLLAVTSPIDGTITTPNRQLDALVGKVLQRGDLVAEVNDLETLIAEIAVPEREIAEVKPGLPVTIKARAFPELEFHGDVKRIATAVRGDGQPESSAVGTLDGGSDPASNGTKKSVTVVTEIDNVGRLLRPNMTGRAKIICAERSILELTMRRIARTFGVEVWSWW